jgi:hypothetical protein
MLWTAENMKVTRHRVQNRRSMDGLPKLRDFPAHAGGSGEVVLE